MQISLKKQIQIKKILKIIKTHDVLLFFAVFYLPQKNRQTLKNKRGVLPQLVLPNPALTVYKGQKENAEPYPLQKKRVLAGTKPQQGPHFILHLHNKSTQFLEIFSHLPLSGQTVLFAIQREEDAQHILTSANLLYKGVFLGGFYKTVYKDKKQYKALCNAIYHKDEIYKTFCRAISFTSYKIFRTTGLVKNKYITLLKGYRQKNCL